MHFLIRVFFDFVHPELLNILKSPADLEVEDQNNALSIFVVCAGDGPESLLACGIPDLQLDSIVIKFECSASDGLLLELEVDADGGEVTLFEWVVSKAAKERGLADGTVTDEDSFELELLGHVLDIQLNNDMILYLEFYTLNKSEIIIVKITSLE